MYCESHNCEKANAHTLSAHAASVAHTVTRRETNRGGGLGFCLGRVESGLPTANSSATPSLLGLTHNSYYQSCRVVRAISLNLVAPRSSRRLLVVSEELASDLTRQKLQLADECAQMLATAQP